MRIGSQGVSKFVVVGTDDEDLVLIETIDLPETAAGRYAFVVRPDALAYPDDR